MDMAGIELTKARPDLDVLDSHEHLVVADSSFRGGSAYLDSLAEGPDEVGPPPQELGGSSNRNQSSSRRKRPTQQQGVPQDESAPPTRSQQPGDVEAPADSGAQQKPLIESGTSKCKRAVKSYFARWKGQGGEAPSIPPWHFLLLSFVGAYAGILAVAACDKFFYHFAHINLLIPSFGASAVILYCSPDSPLGTPRAFVGGQVLSALVGCAMRNAVKHHPWLAAPLAVCLAVLVMDITGTVHPPGGATAFIAATENPIRPVAEFQIIVAVLLDCLAMLAVALVVMNLNPKTPPYPKYWLGLKKRRSPS